MTEGYVIEVVRQLLFLVCLIASPVLIGGLITGLLVGVFQAATQIQESSLSFLPKLIVAGLAITIGGHWALDRMIYFAGTMLRELSQLAPHGRG